jgi:hypothetical protein
MMWTSFGQECKHYLLILFVGKISIFHRRLTSTWIRFTGHLIFRRYGLNMAIMYDPCNKFYINGIPFWSQICPPIFENHEGQKRLYECVGTRLLIKFLNHLDVEYPFVDNVKPFSRLITIFGASAFTRGYGPIKATVAIWGMLRYLSATAIHHPGDFLDHPETTGYGARLVLLEFVRHMSDIERASFLERLREQGFCIDRSLVMYLADLDRAELLLSFLAENLNLLDGLQEEHPSYMGLSGNQATLTLFRGFSVDETSELIRASQRILKQDDPDIVIMGHTHESQDHPRGLKYINTGSWTRYYRFGADDRLQVWSILRSLSYEVFPYELNYAEIVPDRSDSVRRVTFRRKSSDKG